MKLNTSEYARASNKPFLLLVLGLAFAASIPTRALGQQPQREPLATASDSVKKDFTEEWVYRVQYGHKDEWWKIFKKYQIAILERQKQLGYVKDFTVWGPGLHTDENSRWDYRVIIVRASYDAPPGPVGRRGCEAIVPRSGNIQKRREPPLGTDSEPLGSAHSPGKNRIGRVI